MNRRAPTDVPIHDLLANRYSPCGFSDEPVADDDLRALFEAARWAPSSYNEQPWRFVFARRGESAFESFVASLVEGNRGWARFAPVLAFACTRTRFERNGAENRHAFHDVGLAVAQLTVEACARGFQVHQMAGILVDEARTVLRLPEGVEPVTAFAIGRPGRHPDLDPAIAARDRAPRLRRPMSEIVFAHAFGTPAFADGSGE